MDEVCRTHALLITKYDQRLGEMYTELNRDDAKFAKRKARYDRRISHAMLLCNKKVLEQLNAADPLIAGLLKDLKTANDDLEQALADAKRFAHDTTVAGVAIGIGMELAAEADLTAGDDSDDTSA